MKRQDQLNEIVRLAHICAAANKELERKHGIGDLGLRYFDKKSRAYLNEARGVTKPLEDYLNGLSESELAHIETIMYFGRDGKDVHGNDLAWFRKHLEQNRTSPSDIVRNIVEKYGALPDYFSSAVQKAEEERIDLNQDF